MLSSSEGSSDAKRSPSDDDDDDELVDADYFAVFERKVTELVRAAVVRQQASSAASNSGSPFSHSAAFVFDEEDGL